MAESKSLQVKEKHEVTAPAEQTLPGLVFTPEVEKALPRRIAVNAE